MDSSLLPTTYRAAVTFQLATMNELEKSIEYSVADGLRIFDGPIGLAQYMTERDAQLWRRAYVMGALRVRARLRSGMLDLDPGLHFQENITLPDKPADLGGVMP